MDEMLSGPWGILVGGVVGVVVSVLFEDHLLKTRKRLGRRVTTVRRRLGRSEPPAKTLFEIGPIRTSQLIVEGDGTQVIDEQRVSVMVTHQPVEVPAEIQPWIDDKWESQELKLVPFEIGPVCEFIAAEHAKDNLAPHTPALVHLALVHRYGRRTVEREALRVLRR